MDKSQLTRRTKELLTKRQVDLLKLCFKFRFVNARIIAEHRGVSASAVNQTIKPLLKSELLARNYPRDYIIQGRPPEYYLTPAGIRYMNYSFSLNKKVLHTMYKNSSLSQAYVSKYLCIYRLYVQLQKQYGKKLKMFTKSETADNEDMIQPRPDLFMQFGRGDYHLDVLNQEAYFVVRRRVGQIFKDFEQTDLEELSYPTVLLVLSDLRTQKKVTRYIETTKADRFIGGEDLRFMTTTVEALNNPTSTIVWAATDGDHQPVSLDKI